MLFFMGCATIDMSMLDKAEPLKANVMTLTGYNTIGWDPWTVIRERPDSIPDIDMSTAAKKNAELKSGIQMNIGLGKEMELGSKFFDFFANRYVSNKTYLKIRVYHPKETVSLALEPTIGYQKAQENSKAHEIFLWDDFEHDFTFISTDTSCELPIIYTVKTLDEKSDSYSLIGRISYDYMKIRYYDGKYPSEGTYEIDKCNWRAGIYGSMDVKDALVISFGLEVSPLFTGKTNVMPIASIGLRYMRDNTGK